MAETAPRFATHSSSSTAASGAWQGMRPTARRRRGSAEQYSSSHSFTAWQSAPDRSPLMSPLTVSAIWVPKSTATSMPSASMSFNR